MSTRSANAPERLTAFFSGHVQGVGFRFAVLEIAAGFPDVTGSVRNLRDGRVEITAEGSRASLDRFLEAVRQRMRACISNTEVSREPATGESTGFVIAR